MQRPVKHWRAIFPRCLLRQCFCSLLASLSSHLWWPLLTEDLMREETMTMFVYRIHRLRTLWAEYGVFGEAMCEQAAAVMTSYSHRDR